MPDLWLSKDYVTDKIVGYLNRLIDIGVAGFRVDAAKHMWPNDLNKIIGKLNNLPSKSVNHPMAALALIPFHSRIFGDGKKPFIYFEVIDLGGEPIKNTDYTWMARVSEFRYGKFLSEVVHKEFGQKMKYLSNFGRGTKVNSKRERTLTRRTQAGE